jgi:hypothetical protein
MLKLLSLGGLRRAVCSGCGAKVALSPASSFVLVTLGTWLPVAGAVVGAVLAIGVFHVSPFIGGAAGLAVTWALFAAIYFHRAKLILT